MSPVGPGPLMADIANVNLLFLRRIRGIAPLSRFALQSDGTLLVSIPDEMEARTCHIARFDSAGRSRRMQSYQVETLRKTEIGTSAARFLGTTADDLYLFNDGKKSRFQPDRRVSFIDVALAEDGARFVCAFCDLMQSVSTLALGETGGRLVWHKDIPFDVTRVALTRTGEFLAIAGAGGELALYDASRHLVLNHRQDARIDAVATLGPERTAFACRGDSESTGGVGCVGPDGGLLWFTELLGQPVELAVADSGIVAVLLATDTHAGRLVFLSEDGLPIWDIDYDEDRPTGLSLSPDARRAAVTLRDGTLVLYELQLAERLSLLSDEIALSEARRTIESGDLDGALKLLRGRLVDAPGDLVCAALLAETLATRRESLCTQAQQAEAVRDWRAADALLERAQALEPLDATLTTTRAALRTRWKQAALESARQSPTPEEAEAHLLEAIEADPLATDARAELVQIRERAARDGVERGRRLLAIGEASGALEALTEARRRGATGHEADELLRTARIAEALSLGNRLYNDRQWAAALFQYKKVLRLDPRHDEALQKVGYAQNFLADNTLSERFTRLE